MPTNVHFCWCGDFPKEKDKWKIHETPSEVAGESDAQVYYWGIGGCLNQIKSSMPKGLGTIKFRDVTHRNRVLGNCTQKDMPWVDEFIEAVRFLMKERLFIMVKDLVSLMVLQRSGGYFMDTTMKIAPNKRDLPNHFSVPRRVAPRSFQEALKNPPSDLRIPVVHNDRGLSICGMSDDMTYRSLVLPGMGKRDVPEVEVWCMYAPKRSARGGTTAKNVTLTLDEAIERYLKRIRLLRAALDGQPEKLKGVLKKGEEVESFVEDARGVMERGEPYKDFVGAQITGALYDGLLATGYIGRGEEFNEQSRLPSWAWGAYKSSAPVKDDERPPYALPEVGVIKRYGGSWY